MGARFVALALGLAAVGCAVAAAILVKWYTVEYSGAFATAKFELGLFRQCTSGTCENVKFGDITGVCSQSGSDADNRWLGIKIAAIVGMAFGFIGALSGLSGAKSIAIARVICFFIAALATGFAGGFAIYFIDYWYFCETTPCKYLTQVFSTDTTFQCTETIGISLWLYLASTILCVLGLILAAVAMLQLPASKDGEEDPAEPTAEGESGGAAVGGEGSVPVNEEENREAVAGESNEHQQQQERGATAAAGGEEEEYELPEGDWVWDPESEMYWSEENYLFLHKESGMFFDPNSGMWYNQETDEWFLPEEEEEEQY